MKQMLLKRKGSTTMIPTNESLSMIMKLLDEKKEEEKKGEALVKQFLLELREAGVKVHHEGTSGNHFRLQHGEAGSEVSLHGSGIGTRQGWWSVGMTFITKVEKWSRHCGMVFLAPGRRFWVDGCNF